MQFITTEQSKTTTHIRAWFTMSAELYAALQSKAFTGPGKWVEWWPAQGCQLRLYAPSEIEPGQQVYFALQTHTDPVRGREIRRAIIGTTTEGYHEISENEALARMSEHFSSLNNNDFNFLAFREGEPLSNEQ